MRIKKYVSYVFGISLVLFIFNKFYFRPWVIENDLSQPFRVMAYSFPNLIEAVGGTMLVTGIAMRLREYSKRNIKDSVIYLISVSISSIYVISQELKYHNLGGNNVYDFNDLVASILGLIMAVGMLYVFGFIEPSP